MTDTEVEPTYTYECQNCEALITNTNPERIKKCSNCGSNKFKLAIVPDRQEYALMKLNECYDNIIKFIGEWIDIPEHQKKLIAIWIIGTYFHSSFDTYPYLFINAMRGSGKTRLLRIIAWLVKGGKGIVLNNPSEAVIFRTAQDGALIFDEFESEKSKDKQTMREYLNSCYKKDGVVFRMEKQRIDNKEKMVAVPFPLYTPVALANINGLEDVLSDRAITLILEKSMNFALVKKIEDFSRNKIIQEIKTNLYKFSVELCSVYPLQKALDLWNLYVNERYSTSIHTIHTIHNYTSQHELKNMLKYDEIFLKIDNTGIFGRNLELFFPLLLVAHILSEDIFNDLIKIVCDQNREKKQDEFAESKDVSLIEFVSLSEQFRFNYVPAIQLFNEFKMFIGNQGTDDESRWLNITWFGSALKRLKLISDRKRTAKGNILLLNVDKAKEKIKIFKVIDEEEMKVGGKNE